MTGRPLDLARVTALIEETAALEILPRFQKLAAGEIREKSPGDFVTVADEAAEAHLSPRLAALLPGSLVLGEEAAAADPQVLDRLLGEQPVWVVDPVDGTGNFAAGRPGFAVMVALIRSDDVVAGWIHDPIGGRTAVAAAGEGAWIGDRRLKVAPAPRAAREMVGSLHGGTFGSRALVRRVEANRSRVQAVRSLRCAGLEYLRLASGEIHFSLFTKLMPWDHAPGVIIHREAGGHGRYLEGGTYEPAAIERSGLLLAPGAESWAALHEALLGEA
jgi:fructose-1,6-bisphosphatase/inositol monophosphatase family enzyme